MPNKQPKTVTTPQEVVTELRKLSSQFICPKDTYFSSMSDMVQEAIDRDTDKIAELSELREELGVRNRLTDMDAGKGDFIAYANNRTFLKTDTLVKALEYASEVKGKVYERLAADAARVVCRIEEQEKEISNLRALLKQAKKLVIGDKEPRGVWAEITAALEPDDGT